MEKVKMKQEYRHGDLVEVIHLGDSMKHFNKGVAIISNVEHNTCQEGNDWEWGYGLVFIINGVYDIVNEVSWYHHSNLKMIKKGLAHKFKLQLSDIL
jgi:hypothetical protein